MKYPSASTCIFSSRFVQDTLSALAISVHSNFAQNNSIWQGMQVDSGCLPFTQKFGTNFFFLNGNFPGKTGFLER